MPLLNDFGFGVVGGKEKNGYVDLDTGTKYKLKIWNFNTKLRCAADVKIDGKTVGIFRVGKMDSIIIERPINNYGCFTFYAAGTIEAKMVMLDAVDEKNLGLIEVTFYPEKKPIWQEQYALQERDELASLCRQINLGELDDYVAGGTGLSGYSNTDYERVESLTYDYDNIVTIYLRLIAKKAQPRPLPQKTTFSNPIPDPIKTDLDKDKDLSDWIADQQAKLMREKSLLKASVDKSKSFKTKEEMIILVAEQEKILKEYRQKIADLESEELVDYWDVD